ncbi:MAG: hypothetical protein MK226_15270 [Saprospiraceae bacterium]|nr:hypothetical protein [Saprospiraceae bacterium]
MSLLIPDLDYVSYSVEILADKDLSVACTILAMNGADAGFADFLSIKAKKIFLLGTNLQQLETVAIPQGIEIVKDNINVICNPAQLERKLKADPEWLTLDEKGFLLNDLTLVKRKLEARMPSVKALENNISSPQLSSTHLGAQLEAIDKALKLLSL